jgi:transposase
MLDGLEVQLAEVERILAAYTEKDATLGLCATVPGVGLIVAATFVSVIDDARRFKNAHAVGAYLGLVPGEATTGGPKKRRLGSITKQGNRMARAMLIQSAWTIMRSRQTSWTSRRTLIPSVGAGDERCFFRGYVMGCSFD